MPETVPRRFWQAVLKWRWLWLAVALLAVFVAVNQTGNTGPDPTEEQSFVSRADVRQQGAVMAQWKIFAGVP